MGVTLHNFLGEVAEVGEIVGRAGVMWAAAYRGWCEAQGNRGVEGAQRGHLAIKPSDGVGAMPVGPANARAQLGNAEPFEPIDCKL